MQRKNQSSDSGLKAAAALFGEAYGPMRDSSGGPSTDRAWVAVWFFLLQTETQLHSNWSVGRAKEEANHIDQTLAATKLAGVVVTAEVAADVGVAGCSVNVSNSGGLDKAISTSIVDAAVGSELGNSIIQSKTTGVASEARGK